jgi:hypothetical protein
MEEYPESSLWKIDFANGAVSEQFDNGQYPLVSPDGKNILYLTQEYLKDESNPNPKTILKVVSRDGMIKETLDLRENGFYAFAEEMVWNNSDNSIVLTAFSLEDGILKKYILIWNYKKGLLDQLNVDFSTTLLDCREGKIICMDGSVD